MNTSHLRITCLAILLAAIPAGPTRPVELTKQPCRLLPLPTVSHGHRATPRVRNRNGTSSNWSGYAVETSLASPQRDAVSHAAGRWTIPTLSPSTSTDTFSAFWVGIDGADDNTVEQIGTEQDWTSGGQRNYAWFEMFPHRGFIIQGFPVAAGDTLAGGVTYLGGGTFLLSLTNLTQNVAYTVPSRYTKLKSAQRSSAEWVVEAPFSGGVLPLADFGTAFFDDCHAMLDGITGSIDNAPSWQDDPITMETSSGVVKAQPSTVKDSGSGATASSAFSVQWAHE